MPKIHGITYSLDGDKQVYKPGDTVSGYWTVDLGESFSVRGIRTALHGAAYTRWSAIDPKKDDKISKENITTQWRTVFGKKLGEDGPNHTITTGVHKYRFSFKLPVDGLPSSYEGKYGAIRYWLTLQIDRPLLRFNIDRFKTITVLDHIDVNTPEFSKFVGRRTEKKVSKALGIGNQGTVSLHAQTDRGAYCPGEKIAISLIANNDSEKDLGVIKASLIQKTKFVAGDEENSREFVLRTITGASLLKKSKKTWSNQLLQIDAVPPSTRERTCHIVKVSYFLKVLVDIPLLQGGDITVTIPITIGTVPQGYKQSSSATAASNIVELDLSSTVTYTQCNKGYEYFKESGSDFHRLDYNPWCIYVPNFQFKTKPPSAKGTDSTTPKTVTPKSVPSKPSTSQTAQAPPLPSKSASALPPPSVIVPPGLPTSGYAYPQPSAPPIELAPPSYDEAMAGMSGFTQEQPKEESVSDTGSDDEDKPAPKTTFAILRFFDTHIIQFRASLKENGEVLAKLGGEIIALAPQVIVNKGSWSPRTSIAVFLFETKAGAKSWFDDFKSQCTLAGIDVLDAVVGATRELSQNEKNTFHLNMVTISADYKSKDWKRYVTLAGKQLTPLRQEMGGAMLVATRLANHLLGEWPDSKYTITLSQWDSVTQIYEYKRATEDDKYKEVNELRKRFFTVESAVFFQTEDLSFMDESDMEPDSQRADSRQES